MGRRSATPSSAKSVAASASRGAAAAAAAATRTASSTFPERSDAKTSAAAVAKSHGASAKHFSSSRAASESAETAPTSSPSFVFLPETTDVFSRSDAARRRRASRAKARTKARDESSRDASAAASSGAASSPVPRLASARYRANAANASARRRANETPSPFLLAVAERNCARVPRRDSATARSASRVAAVGPVRCDATSSSRSVWSSSEPPSADSRASSRARTSSAGAKHAATAVRASAVREPERGASSRPEVSARGRLRDGTFGFARLLCTVSGPVSGPASGTAGDAWGRRAHSAAIARASRSAAAYSPRRLESGWPLSRRFTASTAAAALNPAGGARAAASRSAAAAAARGRSPRRRHSRAMRRSGGSTEEARLRDARSRAPSLGSAAAKRSNVDSRRAFESDPPASTRRATTTSRGSLHARRVS